MEKFYQLALTLVPNIGPVLAKNLIAYFGSAEEIFKKSKAELSRVPNVGLKTAEDILKADIFQRAEAEMKFIEKNDIKIISFYNDDYPGRLKHFEYSPVIIYFRGSEKHLNAIRTVGIVGTRKPTERGKIFTEKIVEELKSLNVLIVSGLAYGIDGIAHKQAVKYGIPTIGIMGNGHDIIYPAQHREVALKMIDNGGLLTEFPTNTIPNKVNFPMRNRLIAGMSDALIVVESDISGGSIITAEFANEYNKDVFALPGRIDDQRSKGCNALIKRNKAHLIESLEDLIYIMRWENNSNKAKQTSLFIDIDPEEQKIIDFIRHKKEASIDELIYGLKIPTSVLAGQLLALEFKGLLRSLPGSKYMLI